MNKVTDRSEKSAFDSGGIGALHEPFLFQVNPLPSPGDWSSASTVLATPNLNGNELPGSRPLASPHPFGADCPLSSSPVLNASLNIDYFSSAPPRYQHDSFASPAETAFDQCGSHLAVCAVSPSFQAEDSKLLGKASTSPLSPATGPLTTSTMLMSNFPNLNQPYCPSFPASAFEESRSVPGESKMQQKSQQPDTYAGIYGPAPQQGEQLSPPWWSDQISPTAMIGPTALPSPPTPTHVAGSGTRFTDSPKRTKRERLRMASTRYRLNAIRTTANLEEENRQNEKQIKRLRATVDLLQKEVLELEDEILGKSGCSCALMRGYVSAKAQRYIASIAEGGHRVMGEDGSQTNHGNTIL